MAEKRTTYKIQDLGGIGEVHIADRSELRSLQDLQQQTWMALLPWQETLPTSW